MQPQPTSRTRPSPFSALDFKVGLRMLARYPGLTIVGTLAMAVAIALGTAYFEAINKFKNPRLPVAQADRVISIRAWDVNLFREEPRLLADFATWHKELKTVDNVGAAITFDRNLATADGRVESVHGAELSASAFKMLGIKPLLGRTLIEQDEQPAESPVVVISHALWTARFDSASSVIGQSVKLGSVAATIVGVMPDGFGFPYSHHLWTQLRLSASPVAPRTGPRVSIFGRLAPNASIEDARTELGVMGARLSAQLPESHKNLRLRVTPYEQPFGEGTQWRWFNRLLEIVNGVLVLLLAVVSVNIATLVFARTATRGWEITVRTALGASRARIISQLFIEALMLTALAAIVGLFVAKVAMRFGIRFLWASDFLPYWTNDSLSWTTILYTTLLMFVGAAIVGVLPALRVTRINVQDALRNEGAARSGLAFGGFWTAVIVLQVAISVALLPLAANGLFASNRFNERAVALGADRYLAARIDMDRESYGVDSLTFATRARSSIEELERRLLADPAVQSVAFADRLPVEDPYRYNIEVDTTAGLPNTGTRGSTLVDVSRSYFGAFGSALLSGRDFNQSDIDNGHTLLVNQSFVQHVLGGRNPIGQRIRIGAGDDERIESKDWYEIVGVVKDFGMELPKPEDQAAMYRASSPVVGSAGQMVIRANNPLAFASRLRAVTLDVDPSIRLSDIQSLDKVGGEEVRRIRTLTIVAWIVAFIVLVLSATGIHALMSFTVTRRTREIGIRAALGANTAHIVRGIFSRAFVQIGIGLALGTAIVALVGFGSMRQFLLLIAADSVMLIVGLTACAIPLRRALRVDPTEALRAEG